MIVSEVFSDQSQFSYGWGCTSQDLVCLLVVHVSKTAGPPIYGTVRTSLSQPVQALGKECFNDHWLQKRTSTRKAEFR